MVTTVAKTRARIAAVSAALHWEHRQITSNENFDLATARDYMKQHTALSMRYMEEAASMGADMIVGPEYFEGSELFMTSDGNRRFRFVRCLDCGIMYYLGEYKTGGE